MINELMLKTKADLKEGPDNIYSHPWREKEGEGSFEIGRPRSRGWKNIERRWKRGLGGLENWTIFIDIICASSLSLKPKVKA